MPFAGERGETTDLTLAEQAKALSAADTGRQTASIVLTVTIDPYGH
jgi:hypothetical protein